ncbi:AraC family transcriptional regulator [Clostridium sp. SHJSY1]|uniref:AraC family transcriptional regulator n=1 Tax=Clostridium sp. SHJSY1 TaxID=2942483 RepID=UPI002875767F|nr:AraC family transcriptional regulator [Clostridium sp. SHJSY1]MDS0524803.1 AraC family transcriptional regulator [Clostridium sp. SHJSY1]
MNNDTEILLNKKIHTYMRNLSKYFDSNINNLDSYTTLNESIFNFNPTGDIAINLHSKHGNSLFHKHDFFELIYIYSGQCTQKIDNKEMILSKGHLCLVNSKAYHSIITENDEDNIIFNFMFKKSFFSRYFLTLIGENDTLSSFLINYLFDESSQDTYLIFNINHSNRIDEIILSIINEFIDERLGFRSILESLYVILFIEISRNNTIKPSNILNPNKNFSKINEIINYIENNFATTSLKKTAAHFHYHPNYLSKEIKKNTNKTYSEILQNIKLKQACFYLSKTNLSVQEIVEKVGYSELSHFYHIFKKNFTVTPYEYRSQFLNNFETNSY